MSGKRKKSRKKSKSKGSSGQQSKSRKKKSSNSRKLVTQTKSNPKSEHACPTSPIDKSGKLQSVPTKETAASNIVSRSGRIDKIHLESTSNFPEIHMPNPNNFLTRSPQNGMSGYDPQNKVSSSQTKSPQIKCDWPVSPGSGKITCSNSNSEEHTTKVNSKRDSDHSSTERAPWSKASPKAVYSPGEMSSPVMPRCKTSQICSPVSSSSNERPVRHSSSRKRIMYALVPDLTKISLSQKMKTNHAKSINKIT